MIERAAEKSVLMVAPTGGGKTLAGFLPSLLELANKSHSGLHTLYVSPLKALANDVRRNLEIPVSELGLPVSIEIRTGETSQWQRRRQRKNPPHLLLTTPESLALLLTYNYAPRIFCNLKRVVVDEIHALHESKRGDQLMLALSRLQAISPGLSRVGLSATVREPEEIAQFLAHDGKTCQLLRAAPGPPPDISMLETSIPPPWSGGGGRHAAADVMKAVRQSQTALIFINTRAQAELFFQAIWNENSENLPIGIHHGSMSREARNRVEAAMSEGQLRAVICTGTLDLGIDWGNVDLVVQVGTPKNVKRLVQRIGRSNHRYETPSRALIVPANRFEVIECQAALDAVRCDELDGEPRGSGARDVLCQHLMITACSGPFDENRLYDEVVTSGPYSLLKKPDFLECLDFCATGGYALRAYHRWRRLMKDKNGCWKLRDPRTSRSIRMNVGTIVDTETLMVRLRGQRAALGKVEEAFAATLSKGDRFLIGGEVVRYEGLREMTVEVSRREGGRPKIAVFMGTKFSTSTLLMERVMAILRAEEWPGLPEETSDWLRTQREVSRMPDPDRLLWECFQHEGKEYSCVYGFAGRNALQTLGLLLTRRMESAGLHPLGFISNDYAVLIWGLDRVNHPGELVSAEGLQDSFDEWLAGNAVMKRTFRDVAIIAGLIEKSTPGSRKSGRQVTFSTDIIYDTLQKYDPEHLLLKVTREEAMKGLVDFGRIEEMLRRVGTRVDRVFAPHVTPLAAPLLLEVGSVPIKGQAEERLLTETAEQLLRRAGISGNSVTRQVPG